MVGVFVNCLGNELDGAIGCQEMGAGGMGAAEIVVVMRLLLLGVRRIGGHTADSCRGMQSAGNHAEPRPGRQLRAPFAHDKGLAQAVADLGKANTALEEQGTVAIASARGAHLVKVRVPNTPR